MNALPTWQLYDGAAETYDRYRTGYPHAVLSALKERVGTAAAGGKALDVGAGTGIFSRRLLETLPDLAEILCVEPNADMARVGRAACKPFARIRYEQGLAEHLPVDAASRVLVTAATAANWFDRPVFFREVARVLAPGGTLALLQYKHRYWNNPVSADFATFQEHCIPGYRRDTYSSFNGGYGRADFAQELVSCGRFSAVTHLSVPWEQHASPEEFRGYCYSMSHIKKADDCLGRAAVRDELERLIERHLDNDGCLTVGWVTELTMATTSPLTVESMQ
jgi:ubiquinone/menaquinone biosynthesis C-methylase UbiE